MRKYCDSMGVYSKSETHQFMDSDGILVDKKVQFIADVPKFLQDMYGADGGACVSLDSGQGKFLVIAEGYGHHHPPLLLFMGDDIDENRFNVEKIMSLLGFPLALDNFEIRIVADIKLLSVFVGLHGCKCRFSCIFCQV